MTSLLFKSFEYRRTIPLRKHIFYRQIFDALFEGHDLTKEAYNRKKHCGLDIDQFSEVLRYFSFITYREDKFNSTKDEILGYLAKAISLSSNKATVPSALLHDLTHGVPLIIKEGHDYRWIHRSMQEYFAALWICRDTVEKASILRKMYKEARSSIRI